MKDNEAFRGICHFRKGVGGQNEIIFFFSKGELSYSDYFRRVYKEIREARRTASGLTVRGSEVEQLRFKTSAAATAVENKLVGELGLHNEDAFI